jgi:hypothetical protein
MRFRWYLNNSRLPISFVDSYVCVMQTEDSLFTPRRNLKQKWRILILDKTVKTSLLCLCLCLFVFGGVLSATAGGMVATVPESLAMAQEAGSSCDVEYLTITVFDHTLANRDHHALATITLPACKQVVACQLEITEHLDKDDPWVRATYFFFDIFNASCEEYVIGCSRVGPGSVSGDIIAPGQTVTYEYDMSNVQFSKRWPETGSWYYNFIPQDEDDTLGYLSPGEHVIETWISSYDKYSGELPADTWITLKLHLVLEDAVGTVMDDLISAIEDSADDCWCNPGANRKSTMIDKLNDVKDLSCAENYAEAYDKLLHDIKPKLTGLKTDENENPWGNGVFKNPWVTCSDLQEAFRTACNAILTQLATCMS